MAGAAVVLWIQVSTSIGLRGDPEGVSYRDFGSFWAAGDAANHGLNPYGNFALTHEVETPRGAERAVNLNPPFSVLLFQALARGDPGTLFRVWQIATASMYFGVVVLIVRVSSAGDRWLRGLLMLVWEPFWSTLDLGQIYAPLMALATVGYLGLRRYPATAGICIGLLVAVKPQYLVWPFLLLAVRNWRPALVALSVAVGASLVPFVGGHGAWYGEWLDAARASNTLIFSDNLSLPGVLTRSGLSSPVAFGLVAFGLLALFAAAALRRWPSDRASAAALVSSVLAGPVSWVGYALLLVPVVLAEDQWSEAALLAALLLIVPGVVLSSAHDGFLVYDAALVLLLWSAVAPLEPANAALSP